MEEKSYFTTLTSDNFRAEVVECDQPVLVEYCASWSGMRSIMYPILKELADRFQGELKIALLDFEEGGQIAQQYGFWRVPRLLLFKEGQIVDQIMGTVPRSELENRLTTALSTE